MKGESSADNTTNKTEKLIMPDLTVSTFLASIRYEYLVAGLTGGVVSTLVTHPFDLIKLRFAGNEVILSELQYLGMDAYCKIVDVEQSDR